MFGSQRETAMHFKQFALERGWVESRPASWPNPENWLTFVRGNEERIVVRYLLRPEALRTQTRSKVFKHPDIVGAA